MTHVPIRVEDLPTPPTGRTGFPWTEGTKALPKTLPGDKPYPKITVVTPSYQQGRYLEETIRSVLLQGYPNLEYMVMDGGSRDNSVEIIQKYAPFLTFWTSERDTGQANAINKGFARSTGEIMGWLNSDDILLPGALYWIARTVVEKPDVQFVTGFRKNINQESHVEGNFVRDIPTNYYMRHYCCIAQETTYWRRSTWEKLGTLDESFHFALDYDYWLRAIHNGYSFHLIPHYLGGFRLYPENKTSSWLDVYYHDMNVLYRRYSLGEDEADIHAQLGNRWARRYRLYLKMSKQAWTNDPRLVQLAWRILETPVLCDPILFIAEAYKTYSESREYGHQPRLQALRSALGQAVHTLVAQPALTASTSAEYWGNVHHLPDQHESDVQLDNLPADTFVFGKGWYRTEFYQGKYFRWCSGSSEIFIANVSGKETILKLVVSPAIPSTEYWLDLMDEQGNVVAHKIIANIRVEIDVALPVSQNRHARYTLRWNGGTAGENPGDPRRLAFRLLRIGWQNKAIALESALESYQQAVDFMLTRHRVDNLPVVGTLTTAIRRWQQANRIMTQELVLWQQLAENLSGLDAGNKSRTPPRFLIDCSTYILNNNGDKAMFTVLLRRLRTRYPQAQISMVTNDAESILSLDSSVTPIVVGSRRDWSIESLLSQPVSDDDWIDLLKLENLLRVIAPQHYWSLIAASNLAAADAGRQWQTAVQNADAVFLTGGGYFTDAFADHTISLLTTLDQGMMYGAATFIVGCGFEPTTNPLLNALADDILPRVDFIACREALVSPQILAEHGVAPSRLRVTGDDALELAYEARSDGLGSSIGINLRNAVYNPVEDKELELIRTVLASASDKWEAALLPLPISISSPWDSHEIKKLMPEAGGDGGAAIDTPQKLFEQIRQCRLIVTGSYHAAVFGLAMGIPIIALTRSSHYEHKMRGLVTMFSHSGVYEDAVFSLDDPNIVPKLEAAIQRLWLGAEQARPHLLETAERQIRAGHSAYEEIFRRIDHAASRRKPERARTLTLETAEMMHGLISKLIKPAIYTEIEQEVLEKQMLAEQRLVEQQATDVVSLRLAVQELQAQMTQMRSKADESNLR